MDLAMNKVDLKTRLASVPVYTVANSKNEFVLVSGDKAETDVSQLGLFFFNKNDAQTLIERIGEQDAKLARDARVQTLTMDMVYDVFNRPKDDSLRGVSFRFMPDQRQVSAAMAMYSEAGVPIKSFNGIPVFQADGLTVSTETAKYTPIFLAKEDLDVALGSAHSTRNRAQASQYAKRADQLDVEFEAAQKELSESTDAKAKRRAKDRVEKSRATQEKLREKARKSERAGPPKVEVGCFEEVISSMERDMRGEWASVMFIPPGALSQKRG